jgi:hypothetical protein
VLFRATIHRRSFCLSVRKMDRLKYARSFAEIVPLRTASIHEKLLQHAHCVQRAGEG